MPTRTEKFRAHFKPDLAAHSLFGVGLGIIVAVTFARAANPWLGVILMLFGLGLNRRR